MSRINAPVYALNGGQVSRLALGRVDLPRMAVCGELVKNWLTSTLGWMGIRPGSEYLGTTRSNLAGRLIPFVGTAAQCSLLELTDTHMRIWNDGALVTRSSVSTAITNGSFSGLTGWTADAAIGGGSVTASGTGTAYIQGNGTARSTLTQAITVPVLDAGAEHGLTIVVGYGPILMRLGTSSGDDDIVAETPLGTGMHKLAVALTGTVYLQFAASDEYRREIGPVSFDAAGVVEVTTPWAAADIGKVRFDQQGDVIFCACRGYPQQRIESRGRKSWSVAEYRAVNGPFIPQPDDPASITPSSKSGAATLTASRALFRPGHVGAIWELTHTGQDVQSTVAGEDEWTDPIRVTGVTGSSSSNLEAVITHHLENSSRTFTVRIDLDGSWSGTIRLQRAFGAPEGWHDWRTYTADTEVDLNEPNDNAIVFLRLGVKAGEYTAGSAFVELNYPGGTTTGVAKITGFTSNTVVSADVVEHFGDVTSTTNWREGSWSTFRGFPRDLAFQDGRLWWLGSNYLYGSVSDDYANYDDDTEGDSGPVVRSIATGPADGNLWMLKLFNMVVGSAVAINVVRSSAIDEPITPTLFSVREFDQLGAADMSPSAIGQRGVYVGRNGIDLFEISPADNGEYAVQTLMRLVPEIASAGIVRIGVQRRPDPRIHCVLADGTVAVMTFNREENVLCWTVHETDGFVEDVQVLPNLVEDDIYRIVRRTLNGSTVRCVERQSYERDTRGAATTRLADCGRLRTGVAATTISGAADFNGKSIVAWADGKGYENIPVAGGSFTLPVAASNVWFGLPYTAQFRSTKLAYAASAGTALMQRKKVDHLALLMDSTVRKGVKFGASFDRLDGLPLVVQGAEVDPSLVEDEIDDVAVSFNGSYSTDSRFVLEARAPFPCTVKGVVLSVETHDAR